MGIEAATFVSDLVSANPGAADLRSQGDDHLRLIKAVLQASFPTASKAFYNPTTSSKSANFTVVAADMNKTFLVDTSGGAVNMTLPSLGAGDAGWECFHIKTTQGVNPVFVVPASGTVTSGAIVGLAQARRSIPGSKIRSLWTGTAWYISRAEGLGGPVGSCVEFHAAALPNGFEWPSGQTLTPANYPEYANQINGTGITPDLRGRGSVALDNLGGSAAGRIGAFVSGTVLGASGGVESTTLSNTQVPAHTHQGTTVGMNSNQNHSHTYTAPNASSSSTGGGAFPVVGTVTTGTATSTVNLDHSHNFTTDTGSGGGNAFSNLPPSIIVAKLLVVE